MLTVGSPAESCHEVAVLGDEPREATTVPGAGGLAGGRRLDACPQHLHVQTLHDGAHATPTRHLARTESASPKLSNRTVAQR